LLDEHCDRNRAIAPGISGIIPVVALDPDVALGNGDGLRPPEETWTTLFGMQKRVSHRGSWWGIVQATRVRVNFFPGHGDDAFTNNCFGIVGV
jgi:hypothetical protein